MLYESIIALIFFLLGTSIGSFLNLCIDRLPLNQSIVKPGSHCPNCNRKVARVDLIPILNYIWLRGKCRYCRAPIPIKLPIIELLTGLLFVFLYLKFGLSWQLAMSLVYLCIMITISIIDLEHQLILNVLVYPGIIIALVFSIFWPELGIVNALIGGGIGFGLMLLPYVIYPQGMGAGDVKLALMIGLMTGYPEVFVTILLAIVSGGIIAIFLLITRLKKRREPIPFGPFLAGAAMVSLLWGHDILNWYLHFFWV
jgi:leader peptidase (prepilin peptidase)/N-methyltransferase